MKFERNVIYMFPGVGSEYYGMGRDIYHRYSVVQQVFRNAKEAVGTDFYDICFGPDKTKLNYTNAQQSLVCIGYAIYQVLLDELGCKPDYMMGYSLGEYSALACADIIKFEDALNIVKARSEIISETVQKLNGTMAWVINLNRNILEEIVQEQLIKGKKIYISAYEAAEKMSVSGTEDAMKTLAKAVERNNGMMLPINMEGPFHCLLMQEAAEKLRQVLKQYSFGNPSCTVLSNYTSENYDNDREHIITNLSEQLSHPILWQQSLNRILEQGMQTIGVELGPKMVLNYTFALNSQSKHIYSVEKYEDIEKIKQDRKSGEALYINTLKKCMGIITATPNKCVNSSIYKEKVEDEFEIVRQYFKAYGLSNLSKEKLNEMLNRTIHIMEAKGEEKQVICEVMSHLVSDINLM